MSTAPPPSAPFPALPVIAAGMCTSLGGLVAGCAASRAGIQRISELDGTVEEEMVFWGHAVRNIPEGSRGMDRLAHLGALALEDLFSEFPDVGENLGRFGLIVCLPSGYLEWALSFAAGASRDAFSSGVFVDPNESARLQAARESLLPTLLSLAPDLPEPVWTGLVLEDQAGFAEGAARAAALLSQGRLDSCLLGGLDSRLAPEFLEILDSLGLLQTPEFPAGFLPGEAAAFLLLRAPGTAHQPQAWIEGAATAADEAHRFSGAPPVGDSLTEAVRNAMDGRASDQSGLLVTASVNGSPWNSNEWGYLLTRHRSLGEADHWFPVGSFGETGAAFGPVAALMAMRGFSRGYAGAHRAVIVLSSESGRKGAVVLKGPASTGDTP